jgi:hypothetical protein
MKNVAKEISIEKYDENEHIYASYNFHIILHL